MVLAYHIVFGAYGFWLPNDPRGSWSTYVGGRKLYALGSATKVISRRSSAHAEHDHDRRQSAKQALKYAAVSFSGLQAQAVATGIRTAAQEADYCIHACAVMRDHVHLVVARHTRHVKRMAQHLKAKASQELTGELWPYHDDRPVWERGGWAVFLDHVGMVFNGIRYVEANPERDGMPPQKWSFVKTYFGEL